MCKRLDVMSLTQIVDGPPTMDFVDGSGELVKELCVLVGHIAIGPEHRRYLEDLGINMTWAEYDHCAERWERCLMSEAVADLLEDLFAEGDFPHHFEIGPSQGELAWLRTHVRGATERPELPLRTYLLGANAEALDHVLSSHNNKKWRGST